MKKIVLYLGLLLACLPASLSAQIPKISNFSFTDGISITNMSDNGLWAAAHGAADDATIDANPYLFDIASGTSTRLLTDTEVEYGVSSGAYDVTNDGKTIVGNYNGHPAVYTDGQWTELTGANGESLTGTAMFISPDGRYIAGTISGGATPDGLSIAEQPAFWENGVYVALEGLPTEDAIGEDKGMSRVTGMSADGNTLLLCLSYSYPGYGTCAYVYNRQTQASAMVGKGHINSYSHVDASVLSNNGRWVTGLVHEVVEIEDTYYADERDLAYRYNVETGEFQLYGDDEDTDFFGSAVSNEGMVLATTPVNNPVRAAKIRIGDYWYDLEMVLKEKYGINYATATAYTTTGLPVAISDDGKTLAGLAYIKDENYVITFPEEISTVAASVNLLANSTVSPASGSSFAQLTTMSVSFERPVKPLSGAKATLYAPDGTAVRSSISITQGSTARTYSIGFRPTTLDEGVYYRLNIPAGTFGMEGTDIVNKEINVTYIGRANRPVELFDASPSDGATVSELSYNSPILFDFDMQVAIASGAAAELYQADSEDPICSMPLAMSTAGVVAYPSTVRYLYKDVEYTVKVPAGAITDIMGNNPNEEFSLRYTGIYERPLPEATDHIFFEDFSNTSNAYNSFMLYDGDKLTPTADMQSLGFDRSNTPWNFTLRDDDDYDYCAAATSMYQTVGTSDDWMTTVQLNIPGEKYYLTWKSQSYKADKEDRLRVLVWTSDEVLSALTSSVVARMKEEAVEVYNGIESIGLTEETLAGEWTEHKVSLDAFAGKNIYISFVNENTDQSILFVDDVKVAYEGIYSVGNTTEKSVVQQASVPVSGYVRVLGDDTYNTLRLSYAGADGKVIDEVTHEGLGLKKGDLYKFTFDKQLPVQAGRITPYTITVTLDGDVQKLSGEVSNLMFVPEKKVVIEKLTGAWCSNCPLGIVAFDYLEKTFPNNFIPIAIHTASGGTDPYDFSEYAQFLGLNAAPTGRVNRIDSVYNPINTSVSPYAYTSAEGNATFTDIVLRELNEMAPANVEIPLCVYDPDTHEIGIQAAVTYATDITAANYNVSFVLLENGRSWDQRNGFASVDDPILGEWGKNGAYGTSYKMEYDHMARAVFGSYIGQSGYIPTSVQANVPYDCCINLDLSSIAAITDVDFDDLSKVQMKNASIVCLLINANTGRIVNAAIAPCTEGTLEGISTATTQDAGIRIANHGSTVTATVAGSGETTLSLYATDGTLLATRSAALSGAGSLSIDLGSYRGVVIAKATTGAKTATAKLSLK